jgi:hypothetical protein
MVSEISVTSGHGTRTTPRPNSLSQTIANSAGSRGVHAPGPTARPYRRVENHIESCKWDGVRETGLHERAL